MQFITKSQSQSFTNFLKSSSGQRKFVVTKFIWFVLKYLNTALPSIPLCPNTKTFI